MVVSHLVRSGAQAWALWTLLVGAAARTSPAQVIPIKTVPIAEGDQFAIFPSQHQGMGGVAIALADTLLDPFHNPATASRLSVARLFTSPAIYGVSDDAGGGRTLPLAGFSPVGAWYGGLSLAIQEVDPGRARSSNVPSAPPPLAQRPPSGATAPPADGPHANAYMLALLGRRLPDAGVSVATSVSWARLKAVDGVDVLYPGSQRVKQFGHLVDVRVGLLKEWPGDRSFDAVLLHNHYHMSQDVSYLDPSWDPGTRLVLVRPRVQSDEDRADTWGLSLQYARPLAASGWRIGWVATGNIVTQPRAPNYELLNTPQAPGRSHAYQLGVGVARSTGTATFGLDAVYEPIWSDRWETAAAPTETVGGDTIPAGGTTVANRFHFSNALFRIGVGRDFTVGGRARAAGCQLGLAVHAIHYWLTAGDRVQGTTGHQEEWWAEWTPTWGVTVRFPELELRYAGRVTKGAGRPGAARGDVVAFDAAGARSSSVVLGPAGSLTFTDVSVVMHQISLSLPLR